MRRMLILALFLTGCSAHKYSVDPPTPQAITAAARQPAQPLLTLMQIYKPSVYVIGSDPGEAETYLKMKGATEWHGWVFLGNHTYGFLRCEIVQNADGSARLKQIWTPVGTWN